MGNEIEVRVQGLDELRAQLKALPDKLRRRALRNALAAGARIVRDEARAQAPVLAQPTQRRASGTVRNAIVVRTSKEAKRAGDVGVYVNVRPARVGQRGANKPTDPFYWRWLEFGRTGRSGAAARPAGRGLIRKVRARKAKRAVGPLPALGFLRAGAARLTDALRKIEQVLGPAVQRIVDKQSKD
ncbi:MAG: HK97 gp10 family phage protein [Paucibacter sp.]|nr:HK97 gp10 family phage protein [Roseateles sp.]